MSRNLAVFIPLRSRLPFLFLCVSAALLPALAWVAPVRAETVRGIRYSSNAERTRVVLDLDASPDFTHRLLADPPRIVVNLPRGRLSPALEPFSVGDGYVQRVRLNKLRSGRVQVVLDLETILDYKVMVLRHPDRLVLDVVHAGKPASPGATEPKPGRGRTEPPTPKPAEKAPADEPAGGASGGGTSASGTTPSGEAPVSATPAPPVSVPPPRHRDYFLVAVDAGHGGEDLGARYFKTNEKDITLKLARELVRELNKRKGIKAFMVRKGDYFIPLYQRRRIAERDSADLFVSLHCNASRRSAAKGTEVYFLSVKGASDEAARELAARENEVDEKMGVAADPENLGEIVFDMIQTDVLSKSQMLAETCLTHLFSLGTVYNRGVKQAGFAVLKSPRIPSILVEAAFLSNRKENRLLRSGKWQRRFGKCMADGIEAYCRSIEQAEYVGSR